MAGNSDLIDVHVQLHAETERAFLVSLDGDKARAVWVPKSQCEISDPPHPSPGEKLLTLPEWLAFDKGLT